AGPQQPPGRDLAAGGAVGEDVGLLVADVGQRVLEACQTLSAPPAKQLLQPVRDEYATEAYPQNQQAQVLGAATGCGTDPLIVEVLVFAHPVGREYRVPAGGLGWRGQRFVAAYHTHATARRADAAGVSGVVVRNQGRLEIA